jgi:hypothetical protein
MKIHAPKIIMRKFNKKFLARRLITKNRRAKGYAKKKLIKFSKNHHARRLITKNRHAKGQKFVMQKKLIKFTKNHHGEGEG